MPRFYSALAGLLILSLAGTASGDKRGFGGVKRVHGHRQDIQRWAVVIGISKYAHPQKVTPLKYAAADAKAFHDFIKTPVGGGFDDDHVRLLLDEQATVQAVRSALGTFLKKAVKDDLVYIYFAGHGAPEPKNPSNLYFLTYEADPDDLFGTALPMDQITYILQKHIFAERVVVLTDACHSAGIGGSLGGTRGGSNAINQYVRELARTKPGRAVITGSRTGEYSQEGKRWGGGHGAFTHHWLQGLKGAADADANGIVTLGEAFDYTSRNVARDTQNNQHPDTLGNFDNDMPLAVHDPRQYEQAIKGEQARIAELTKKVAAMEKQRKQLSGQAEKAKALAEKRKALEARLAALASEKKRVNCPADMARIDKLFCIDRYEYPNKAGGEPQTEVDYDEAADLCAKQGKRLCKAPSGPGPAQATATTPTLTARATSPGPAMTTGAARTARPGRPSSPSAAARTACSTCRATSTSGSTWEAAPLGSPAAPSTTQPPTWAAPRPSLPRPRTSRSTSASAAVCSPFRHSPIRLPPSPGLGPASSQAAKRSSRFPGTSPTGTASGKASATCSWVCSPMSRQPGRAAASSRWARLTASPSRVYSMRR